MRRTRADAAWLRPSSSAQIRRVEDVLSFVPAQLAPSPALVVVLHGCGQTGGVV